MELLFKKKYASECEARTLAATRDTLLPELLSGDIRLNYGDAELTE